MKKSALILICVITVTCCKGKKEMHPVTETTVYDFPESKLWAHRVKNAAEATILFHEFNGIELDVVYDNNTERFDLRHDPDSPASGIDLESFFDSIPDVASHYYWIDFKNLYDSNATRSAQCINALLDKYRIRKNVIVESTYVGPLKTISRAGINTSYWVPEPGNGRDTLSVYHEICTQLEGSGFDALSASYTAYPFLNKYFPNCTIHLWTNNLVYDKDKEIIRSLHNQSNVKIILVDIRNNFIRTENSNAK